MSYRAALEAQLEIAQRHVRQGNRDIARMEKLVRRVALIGASTSDWEYILETMRDTQRVQEACVATTLVIIGDLDR